MKLKNLRWVNTGVNSFESDNPIFKCRVEFRYSDAMGIGRYIAISPNGDEWKCDSPGDARNWLNIEYLKYVEEHILPLFDFES